MARCASTATPKRSCGSTSTSKQRSTATERSARRRGKASEPHPRSLSALARPDGAGSLSHYAEPAEYARTYLRRKADIAYYVGLAQATAGSVLEYGVGNGRVALPTARAGLEITGVDLSRPMLADLRTRLRQEPSEVRKRVRLRYGDMRKVRLTSRFELITAPFNVILHLYTREDLERFLARVCAHLSPRGRFVFDYSVPEPKELARDPNRPLRLRPFSDPLTGERITGQERFFYDRFGQVLLVWTELEQKSRGAWDVPLTHRQYFPREMEALLHYNGLEVEEVRGDFGATRELAWADSLVLHCRRRRALRAR